MNPTVQIEYSQSLRRAKSDMISVADKERFLSLTALVDACAIPN